MSAEEHEQDFTLEEQFESHFADLVMKWQELGIDPDDFIKCALCRELLFDPDNDFKPTVHCQDTWYIIRTASDMHHAVVKPEQGGFRAADREARRIKGRLFGIDINGKEVRMAFYDLVPPRPELNSTEASVRSDYVVLLVQEQSKPLVRP